MRFKAKLVNDQLSILHAVVASISKLQDSHRFAVLYLDKDYIRISCKSIDTGITCFAELCQKELFLEHRIESAANNVIVCQVDLVSFRVALQSVVVVVHHPSGKGGGGCNNNNNNSIQLYQDQPEPQGRTRNSNTNHSNASVFPVGRQPPQQQAAVILKLAKRNHLPCLCLERHCTTMGGGGGVEIYQAIPVLILRPSEMQHHLPPPINHPQVQLELPIVDRHPILLRSLMEKLKSMSKLILVKGTMKGDLTIRMDHDGASLACFYNHLIPRWPETQQQQQEEENEEQEEDDHHDQVHHNPSGSNNNSNNDNNNKQQHRNNNATTTNNSSCILKVNTQKLLTCLQWQQSNLRTTSCLLGMVYNEMLVLHVLLSPEQVGFFTYYLPVHFLHEEDLADVT